jgi:hypothetical protein
MDHSLSLADAGWEFEWQDHAKKKFKHEGGEWNSCDFDLQPKETEKEPEHQNSILFKKIRLFFDDSFHCDVATSWREVQAHWSQQTIPSAEHTAESASGTKSEVERIFEGLAENWTNSTAGFSVTMRRYAHPSYQAILGLGKEVVPLILKKLKDKPDFWFEALTALEQPAVNPVRKGASFAEAVDSWLEWGRNQKLIN